jgi:hypothetical protein
MSANVDHIYEGFIRHTNSDESAQYLTNVSTRTFVMKDVAYAAQVSFRFSPKDLRDLRFLHRFWSEMLLL